MDQSILIVDDSQFDRDLLAKALARRGRFRILEANSGDQCLEILATQQVDLILMDILMPGTIGTQVLLKIRERFNAIELPIIMVTAKADPEDVVGCLQTGANDYISKPINFDVTISRILTHLKLAELSRKMSKFQEMAALDAMVTTYHHEINNPLTIALGSLNELSDPNSQSATRLRSALERIADIVKKIRKITDKKEAEFETYVGSTKMVKIR